MYIPCSVQGFLFIFNGAYTLLTVHDNNDRFFALHKISLTTQKNHLAEQSDPK